MQDRIYFDDGARGFLLMALISQFFLNNGIYLFFGAFCFAIIVYNLQKPFKPSVFTIVFIYHFMQISAWIWLSNYLGKDVNYKSDHSGTAILLSYIGSMLMFAPVIFFQNKIPLITRQTLERHADRLSIQSTFKAYVICFLIVNAMGGIAFKMAGLAQIIISLANIKWFLFLLFGFQVVLKKRMKKQFYIFIALEFVLGFLNFFSEFKTIIFFIGCIYLTLLSRVYLRQIIITIVVLIGAFLIGVFWSGIKSEYRAFLNRGSSTQSVQVSKNDALDKLLELSEKQDQSSFDASVVILLDRIQYTYHLAKAMDMVPEKVPYQRGNNWKETIEFALTPRILNPDKPNYEASGKTTKYTGIGYLGARHGVSVSLGYFADGYVDFGYVGMFIPLILLGIIYGGSAYYFLRNASDNYVFNYSVVGAIFMEFMAFEMDSTYLLGRLFATLLTFTFLRFAFFPWLLPQLRVSQPLALSV